MKYTVRHGEFGTRTFFIKEESTDRTVCGVSPLTFDGDFEKAKQMAIKICFLLNEDAEKGE